MPRRIMAEAAALRISELEPAAVPAPVPVIPARRFRQLKVQSVFDAWKNLPAKRPWLFESALESGQVTLLTGGPKLGKSWVAHDMVVSALTGTPWLGQFEPHLPPGGRIVLLDLEYGVDDTSRRLARLARGRRLDPDLVLQPSERFLYIDARESGFVLFRQPDNAFDELVDFLTAERNAGRPSFVIVDPLRNALVGDENDAGAALLAMSNAAILRDAAGLGCLITHHTNKGGAYSGSKALYGRTDNMWQWGDEGTLAVSGRRVRSGSDRITQVADLAVTHRDVPDDQRQGSTAFEIDFDDDRRKSKGTQLSAPAAKLYAALRKAGRPMTGSQLRSTVSNGARQKSALEELRERGMIEQAEGGRWQVNSQQEYLFEGRS